MEKITSAPGRQFSFPSPIDVQRQRAEQAGDNNRREKENQMPLHKCDVTRVPATLSIHGPKPTHAGRIAPMKYHLNPPVAVACGRRKAGFFRKISDFLK